MLAMLRISLGLVALSVLSGARQASSQMDPHVQLLQLTLGDAEYSASLDRIVISSNAPSSRLVILDPSTGVARNVPLPYAEAVSVAPDGLHAAVGHQNGTISYVDLQTATVVESLPVSTNLYDLVLAGNGYVYAFPQIEPFGQVRNIEIATGQETLSAFVLGGLQARLHPDGDALYGSNHNLIPGYIEKYDISGGAAQFVYVSPDQGQAEFCGGTLWLSQDGQRIFTRCGEIYSASDQQASDMLKLGDLTNLTGVRSLWHSPATGQVYAIPQTLQFYGYGVDTDLNVYEDTDLGFLGAVALPPVVVGHVEHLAHGRFVFVNDAGTRVSILVEADSTAGLALDAGLVTYVPRFATASSGASSRKP